MARKVQGSVAHEEGAKYPMRIFSFSNTSPIYLNQVRVQSRAGSGIATASNELPSQLFANNAKVLATHLISLDSDNNNYQILHLIDKPLEFAYVSKKSQLRHSPAALATSLGTAGSGVTSGLSSVAAQMKLTRDVRQALKIDELLFSSNSQLTSAAAEAINEFHERFGDYSTHQPQVELFRARAQRGLASGQQRVSLSTGSELNFERLTQAFQAAAHLRSKLANLSDASPLNTYFLPVHSEQLDTLLDSLSSSPGELEMLLGAHIVPNQVLFTRVMGLGGVGQLTMAGGDKASVALSLAKSLPQPEVGQHQSMAESMENFELEESRKLLSTPLLLQSKYLEQHQQQQEHRWPMGVASAEILVADIPLAKGVLHLIKKPILASDSSLMDYINDNENQLSEVALAMGSQTSGAGEQSPLPVKLASFRELLARERLTLSALTGAWSNVTILAPSDEAFGRLRYELRALIKGDDSMIPVDWSDEYKRAIIERMVKRHVIQRQALTSQQLINIKWTQDEQQVAGASAAIEPEVGVALSASGARLCFEGSPEQPTSATSVESDKTRAHLVQRDFAATNGVLHVLDRVLGEELESVHSLLRSIVASGRRNSDDQLVGKLSQLNELSRSSSSSNSDAGADETQPEVNSIAPVSVAAAAANRQATETLNGTSGESTPPKQTQRNEQLAKLSQHIGRLLDELAAGDRRKLQHLATSVNISYQVARLAALADGRDDWNEQFKANDKSFTYFVPSDLAWLKLQQVQPEFARPLVDLLAGVEHSPLGELALPVGAARLASSSLSSSLAPSGDQAPEASIESASVRSRASVSSQRLRQILERHLVLNRKLNRDDLNKMDSLEATGASLRLTDNRASRLSQSPATLLFEPRNESPMRSGAASAFAALHSIVSGGSRQQQQSDPSLEVDRSKLPQKSISLDVQPHGSTANVVWSGEASNGFVYIVDSVLVLPEDVNYVQQTSQPAPISYTMSLLASARSMATFEFYKNLFAPGQASAQSMMTLISSLSVTILGLLLVALALIIRRRRLNKNNQHQQLESGLTSSSSSASNSGSTSTTKSL